MSAYIVFFLLFFLPLLVLPLTNSPFEAPKVILAEILIEILLFISLITRGVPKSDQPRKTHLFLVISLFLLSLISLISLRTPTTFFGNPFRLQGVFLLWHLLIFSIISKNIKLDHLPKFLFLLALLGLLIGALIMGGNEAGRAVGTLGEPNALAGAAIFIWPFAFLNPLSPLITLIILILSGSRSGLLAFAIQVIFLSLITLRSTTVARIVILCLILMVSSLILPFTQTESHWAENRSEVWKTALFAGLQSPIFGSGFGNMEFTLKDTSKLINNNIQYQYVDSSHNFLLDYWVQGGILGLILIISTLYFTLLGLIRRKNILLLCSFLGILTVMSFNPVSVVTLLTFWFLVGQAAGPLRRSSHSARA